MFDLDATTLARIQFALNISFHILFPTITIGLAWLLLFFRVRFTATRNEAWEYAYYFWVKIFALTFALGVVSGVTMSFQFGTNWPGFIERAGNISGPLLGYEVLTAFFIEATFSRSSGKDRVSNSAHLVASALVAVGTTLSAFWILSLNSWMQTPQGHEIVDGKFYAVDWWRIDLQPVVPVPLRAHDDGLIADGRVLGRGRQRRAYDPARRWPRDSPCAEDRRVSRGRARAAASRARRSARLEHARAPAREDRGNRGRLGDGSRRAVHRTRLARRGAARDALRPPDSARHEPDPHA
jgi:hypothetical protein